MQLNSLDSTIAIRYQSMLSRFPWDGSRNRANWAIYNAFFRKGGVVTREFEQLVARPTPEPEFAAMPPLLPQKAEWRELVLGSSPEVSVAAAE
jgi:hypothetical protein